MNRCSRWGFILCVVYLAGCSPKSRDDCTSDDQCSGLQACIQGICTAVECKQDSDCSASEQCLEYECSPGQTCTVDRECPIGSICVSEVCTVGCREDQDCATGLVCIPELSDNGACRAGCRTGADCLSGQCDPVSLTCIDTTCSSKDDCELGQLCIEGNCLAGCESDRDCDDSYCALDQSEHGLCVDCTEDNHCLASQKCIEFQCREYCENQGDCTVGYCDTATHGCVDCLQDAHCELGSICVDQSCTPGCRNDQGCPLDQICENDLCRYGCRIDNDCLMGVCNPDSWLCMQCVNKADCDPGYLCIANYCTPGCENTPDCPDNQECIDGQCLATGCATREDCAGSTCLVCIEGECLEPQAVCETLADCCVGSYCNFGSCIPDDCDCLTDEECPDESFPQCLDCSCVPDNWECITSDHCQGAEVCIDNACVSSPNECVVAVVPEDRVELGEVAVGETVPIIFKVSNLGQQSCEISEIDLAPAIVWASDFELANPPQTPLSLAPHGQNGSEIEIEVLFAPEVDGNHTATLWITSDDPDLYVGSTEIACYGLVAGQACIPLYGDGVLLDADAVPSVVDFGSIILGCNSVDQGITIYNSGNGNLLITNVSLSPASSSFEITSAPAMPVSLPISGSVDLGVRFTPQGSGTFNSSLVISFDQLSPITIPLSGLGTSATSVSDTFQQPSDIMVDVLFVVDNSGSMGPFQTAMAAGFDSFIQLALNLEINFHIGVIATEINQAEADQGTPPRDIIPGVLIQAPGRPKVLTPSTPNLEDAFIDNLLVGDCCSDEQEAGLKAAQMALGEPLISDANAGFMREGARLYVICISNEQDQSPGSPSFFADFFASLKGYNPDRMSLSAVCGDAPNGCYTDDLEQVESGSRYIDVAEQTYGIFESICTNDFDTVMANLGQDAFSAPREFSLSRIPVTATIHVTVNGSLVSQASCQGCANGWTYFSQTNTIFFGDDVLPAAGASITVGYTAACL